MYYLTLGVAIGALLLALGAAAWLYLAPERRKIAAKALILLVAALALASVAYGASRRAQRVDECAAAISYIGAALETYGDAYDGQYPHDLEELMPTYFDELPVCPQAAGDPAWKPRYERSEEFFTVYCTGDLHRGWGGAPEGFPRYSSAAGLEKR